MPGIDRIPGGTVGCMNNSTGQGNASADGVDGGRGLLGWCPRADGPAPALAAGDSWNYLRTVEIGTNWRQTHAELTVTHASTGSIGVSDKVVGSSAPAAEQLMGPDWSRVRSVNGHETVVNRPLAFPLSVGKSWVVDYAEDHPNRQHTSEHFHTPYKAVGWEDVTVPAGTFRALKIEADGEWSAAIAPAVTAASGARVDAQGSTTVVQTNRIAPSVASRRTYHAFWYVPAVKRWVKSVEEYYGSGGARTASYKDELESFKAG